MRWEGASNRNRFHKPIHRKCPLAFQGVFVFRVPPVFTAQNPYFSPFFRLPFFFLFHFFFSYVPSYCEICREFVSVSESEEGGPKIHHGCLLFFFFHHESAYPTLQLSLETEFSDTCTMLRTVSSISVSSTDFCRDSENLSVAPNCSRLVNWHVSFIFSYCVGYSKRLLAIDHVRLKLSKCIHCSI